MFSKSNYHLAITLLLRVFNAAGQLALAFFILKAYGKSTLLLRQGFDRTLILIGVRKKLSSHVKCFFTNYLKKILFLSPVFGVLNLGVFYFTSGVPENSTTVLVLLLLPLLFSTSFLVSGYFTGTGKTVSATIQQPGFSAAITTIILFSCTLAKTPENLILAYFVVVLGTCLFGLLRLSFFDQRAYRATGKKRITKNQLVQKVSSAYSRRYLVINFFTTFSSVYFITYLALFVSDELIGEFKVVERVAMVIAFNLSFINVILPSKSIHKFNKNDMKGFAHSIKLTFLFQYITGGCLALLLIVFGSQATGLLELSNAYLYYFLITAQLINSLTGPVRVLLMYLGGQKVLQISAIAETIGSMVLYWTLYTWLGLTGLAIGYFIAISTPNIVLACIVYKRFGIIPLPITQSKLHND